MTTNEASSKMLSARWPRKRRSFVSVESIVQFAPSHDFPSSSGHPPSRWMISLSVLTSSPPDSPKIWRSQVTRSYLRVKERDANVDGMPPRSNLTTHRCAPNRFAETSWPIWRLQSSFRCCCHRWDVKKLRTGCCLSARWRYPRRRSRLPDNFVPRTLRKQNRKSYRKDQRCCLSCNTKTRREIGIQLPYLREEICLPLQDRGAGMDALWSRARLLSPDSLDGNEHDANYNWNCFATHVFALDRLAEKEKLFEELTLQIRYGGCWPTQMKPGTN